MFKTFIKPLGLLAVLALVGFMISCQKEDEAITADTFVSDSVTEIQERSGAGIFGCYELVFPVTIQFADSTTASVNSYEELRQAIHDWFQANGGRPHHGDRPTLVFPFQVTNSAGEIITVENQQQLQDLKALCDPNPGGGGHDSLGGHGGHGHHGHHGGPGGGPDTLGGPGGPGGHHGNGPCYTLVFPVTINFPDNSQLTVNSPEELRNALHAWKENNPGSTERPQLAFPLTVTLRDGTQVVVNTPEELQAIKDACRG